MIFSIQDLVQVRICKEYRLGRILCSTFIRGKCREFCDGCSESVMGKLGRITGVRPSYGGEQFYGVEMMESGRNLTLPEKFLRQPSVLHLLADQAE